MRYDARNKATLLELAPNTQVAALDWYGYCLRNQVDLLVYDARRTIEEQRRNVATGASQTMKSYHLVGQAFDFVPIINGNAVWDSSNYRKKPWADAIAYAEKLGFTYGGDWPTFKDYPHLEFHYKGYGTDLALERPKAPDAGAKSAQVSAKGRDVDGAYVRDGVTYMPLRRFCDAYGMSVDVGVAISKKIPGTYVEKGVTWVVLRSFCDEADIIFSIAKDHSISIH